ncbi:hypothetical protein FACS1894164_05160 [Spirochaetia bacterium]|nr:hypothetical protein FACS1894164_05160 [Spirochaetia bacterium]
MVATKILVDSTIWSKFLRRKYHEENKEIIDQLNALIRASRAVIIGAVRQEILSGVPDNNVFNDLKSKLSIFSDHIVETVNYELAAEYFNICRKHGIQGSTTDFLICAVSVRFEIFTEDKDFLNYKQCLPIKLYKTE